MNTVIGSTKPSRHVAYSIYTKMLYAPQKGGMPL